MPLEVTSTEEKLDPPSPSGRVPKYPDIPDKLIRMSDKILGKGSFGEVRIGTYIGTPVAIKIMHNTHDDVRFSTDFEREVQNLKHLTHPNIVSIVAHDSEIIVMELYDSSLKQIRNSKDMCLVARDCMRAISFMHSHNNDCIRHRDIKPDNILVKYDQDGRMYKASLGDVGLSTLCSNKNTGGTRGFTPFIKNSSDRMYDVVALGVSILDAIFEERVHGGRGTYETIDDYPRPGKFSKSDNNTMYFAHQLLPEYYKPMSEMLVLAYMPGNNEDEKTSVLLKLQKEWEELYEVEMDKYYLESEKKKIPENENLFKRMMRKMGK